MRLDISIAGLVAWLAACGSPAEPTPVAADYVGTFELQPGSTSVLDCQDNALDGVSAMTGEYILEVGDTSELVEIPQPGVPCFGLKFDVVGGVANAQPNQVCRRTTDDITFESTFTAYKLELDGDTLTIDGFINVDVSGAISTICTSTDHGVATRKPSP